MAALDEAISTAEGLDETDYSSGSWAVVEAAMTAAIAIRENENSTNEAYLIATDALVDAMTELSPLTCATPVADPAAGAVLIGDTVELTTETDNAHIYFTTDGSTPDEDSNEYAEPIEITGAMTIKAIAMKGAMVSSEVLSAGYTILVAATPTADPAAGEVADNTPVALACGTAGATIRFTLDGSTPDEEDIAYTEPIVITDPVTIKAKAFKTGMTPSSVLSAAYTIAS
jgi:chitinase